MKSPCFKCPERYPGCHDYCEEYQSFQERRKEIQMSRLKRNNLDDYFIEAVRKVKKKRRLHG